MAAPEDDYDRFRQIAEAIAASNAPAMDRVRERLNEALAQNPDIQELTKKTNEIAEKFAERIVLSVDFQHLEETIRAYLESSGHLSGSAGMAVGIGIETSGELGEIESVDARPENSTTSSNDPWAHMTPLKLIGFWLAFYDFLTHTHPVETEEDRIVYYVLAMIVTLIVVGSSGPQG